jgi:hypothetical protein
MNDVSESELKAQLAQLSTLRGAIAQAIVGQDAVVEQLLIGLLAGGHCLLEGVPGWARPCWCVRSGRRLRCSSGACSSRPT